MINKVVMDLFDCFPKAIINRHGEFIACGESGEFAKSNKCFNIFSCKDELEVKCKVLEFFSRSYKEGPWSNPYKNKCYQRYMLDGINKFLGTSFDSNQLCKIYSYLGNGVKRSLTIQFIESGYDLELLKEDESDDQ